MARLGIAAGFAVVGYFIPGVGPGLGFALGSIAAQYIIPPDTPDFEKPKLDDLAVQESSYGVAIPEYRGTERGAGNVIWVRGNTLEAFEVTEEVEGGGKGFSGPTVTTTHYRVTCAILICAGPIGGVRRIWADKKLILDTSAATVESAIVNGTPAAFKMEGLNYRLYLGTEDQMPDPAIEAEKGDLTPAWRGWAYIVFEDFPLDNFINHLPQFEFEVMANAGAGLPVQQLTGATTSFWSMARDYARRALYLDLNGFMHKRDLVTGTVLWSSPYIDPGVTSLSRSLAVDEINNRVYSGGRSFPSNGYVYQIDGDTGAVINRAGPTILDAGSPVQYFFAGEVVHIAGRSYLVFQSVQPTICVYDVTGGHQMLPVGYLLQSEVGSASVSFCMVADRDGRIWYLSEPTSKGCLIGLEILPSGDEPQTTVISQYRFHAITDTVEAAITGARGLYYDAATHKLLIHSGSGTQPALFYDIESGTFSYGTDENGNQLNGGDAFSGTSQKYAINGKAYYGINAFRFVEVDFATQSVTRVWNLAAFEAKTVAGSMYLPDSHAVLTTNTLADWDIYFLDRADDDVELLADVIANICTRAVRGLGLTVDDIDLSRLTGAHIVRGTRWATPGMAARSGLEPLLIANMVDAVLIDGKVHFVPRGTVAPVAIPPTDLGAHGEGDDSEVDKLREPLPMPAELPYQLNLTYRSGALDYAPNTVHAKRADEAVVSRDPQNVHLSVVLTEDEAARLVEKMLYAGTLEARPLESVLMPRWRKLTPTDVVKLTRGSVQYEARLLRTDEGDGGILAINAVPQAAAAYVSTVTGPVPDWAPHPILLNSRTGMLFFDVPSLRDNDNEAPSFYYALYPLSPGLPWPGATVSKSQTGASFNVIGFNDRAPAYGALTLAATVPPSMNRVDKGNTLTVKFLHGSPVSVTRLEMLNGANAAALGNPTDGWEIVRFQDATEISADLYELTNLVRGCRGTEHLAIAWPPGTQLVILREEALRRHIAAGEAGLTRYYKAVTLGQTTLEASRAFVFRQENLKPRSVCHVSGARDGSNNLTGTFIRRSRYSGRNRHLNHVPLGEVAEAYEIDVLLAGTVIRTITATSETFEYMAAEQTADGITPGTPIDVAIYQMGGADMSLRGNAAMVTL